MCEKMQTDFLDAHERHWRDAELLWQQKRLANADHLFGIAAECGLKRLMLAFDMPFGQKKQNMPDNKADQVHANGIWDRYESYRSGHVRGAGYALSIGNPFSNWDVNQRYAPESEFDEIRVESHRQGAKQANQLIRKALGDGLI